MHADQNEDENVIESGGAIFDALAESGNTMFKADNQQKAKNKK